MRKTGDRAVPETAAGGVDGDESEAVILQLEHSLDEDAFDLESHAQLRAVRVGSASFIKSVLVPLADLIRDPLRLPDSGADK